MLDVKVQAELNAMRAETEQLREKGVAIIKRSALRDALLARGVPPRMIKGASAVVAEYVHVHDDGRITGPDYMPLEVFLDTWCESGEGTVFLNGGAPPAHHQPGLMATLAKNLS